MPLVLSILYSGESYGYAIIGAVRELSDDNLNWTDGMLYPVLHRLEKQGHISSIWRIADNGRKRKYYRITEKGKAELERQKMQWNVVQLALDRIWKKLEE
jgi:PadR family transcriptional regulator PadR